MPHTHSSLIKIKRLLIAGLSNVYAVKLNDEVVVLVVVVVALLSPCMHGENKAV